MELLYDAEELWALVKGLSERYTGKANTSVTYETAHKLLEAVYYCIGVCERYYGEEGYGAMNESAPACIAGKGKRMAAAEAYEAGYRIILEKAGRARESYMMKLDEN